LKICLCAISTCLLHFQHSIHCFSSFHEHFQGLPHPYLFPTPSQPLPTSSGASRQHPSPPAIPLPHPLPFTPHSPSRRPSSTFYPLRTTPNVASSVQQASSTPRMSSSLIGAHPKFFSPPRALHTAPSLPKPPLLALQCSYYCFPPCSLLPWPPLPLRRIRLLPYREQGSEPESSDFNLILFCLLSGYM
jgi:hypothetical protein